MSVALRMLLAETIQLAPLRTGDSPERWSASLVHLLHLAYQDLALSLRDIRDQGQGRIVLDGGEALLGPYGGDRLFADGRTFVIPGEGLRLRSPGTANTTYWLYAFPVSRDTLSIEASTAEPQSIQGVRVRGTDSSRTLVGMGRTDSTGAWSHVLSWVNPQPNGKRSVQPGALGTASAPWVELNAVMRIGFLTWGGVAYGVSGRGQNDTAGSGVWTGIGFDGVVPEPGVSLTTSAVANAPQNVSLSGVAALAEGYHELLVLGGRQTSGTTSYGFGSVAGDNLTAWVTGLIA